MPSLSKTPRARGAKAPSTAAKTPAARRSSAKAPVPKAPTPKRPGPKVPARQAPDARAAELQRVADQLVELALSAGAGEAEAYCEGTRESSVRVRDGEVEELSQATSKGVGLRVITGGRLGFAY
ncbi:MAG TPA: DNA gyrase modulator, partial [Myxococcales bacterium]|nr:DNA gyrase modulator [Myxococcales bacterium]